MIHSFLPRAVLFAGLLVALALADSAVAQTCPPFAQLYASTTSGNNGPSSLYRVDPATGAATLVGLISPNIERVGSLAFGPDEMLYGVGERTSDQMAVLIQINRCSAAGAIIGTTNFGGGEAATDISFRDSDGVLFGYTIAHNVYTINTTTGGSTVLGNSGFGGAGNGIAFSSANILFLANGGSLYTINQTTGAATLVSVMTFPAGTVFATARVTCLDFHPITGELYGVVNNNNVEWYLATINTTTAVVTKIGATITNADGIAFALPGPDSDFVPTAVDNCPNASNLTQTNSDGDPLGDACDNCPNAANADQANADGDAAGDLCDDCPNDVNKSSTGACGCGVADTDANGNGVADCNEPAAPPSTPEQPQPVVDRTGLRNFLSLLFGVPLCATGAATALPLTIIGWFGLRLTLRRRRNR